MSLFYAPVINIFMKIMTPFIFIVNGLSTGLLMLLRIDPNAKDNTMTEAELRSVVNVSHQDGVIESDEKEMIYNVFDLGDAIAKDVMVPRVNVTFADIRQQLRRTDRPVPGRQIHPSSGLPGDKR